jgi:uncharacterized protein (TIGR03083 family)
MTATATLTGGKFFGHLIGSGFRFKAMQDKDIARQCEGSPGDTLARFQEQLDATTHPPGPNDTWLGETIIHAEDIRRPLGISHEYPVDAVVRSCESFKGSNLLIGAKKRIAGLTLKATDADWSTGSGPEVSGPAISLLMAMTGRSSALDDLTGDGLDTLRGRK